MVTNYSVQPPHGDIHREDIRIYTDTFMWPNHRVKKKKRTGAEIYVQTEEQLHIYRFSKHPGWHRELKHCRKQRSKQTNKNTPKKTGIRIYERAEKGGKEPSGTTSPMFNKQFTLLLWEDFPANNDKEKKNNTFYSIKKGLKIPNKLTQMGQKTRKGM